MQSTTAAIPPDPYTQYYTVVRKLVKQSYSKKLVGWCDPSSIALSVMRVVLVKQKKRPGETVVAAEGWLWKIVNCKLIDKIREMYREKRDRRRTVSLDAALEESSPCLGNCLAHDDLTAGDLVVVREQLDDVKSYLAQLPCDQAEAVSLHHLKGNSIEETARMMGKTQPAVAGLLRRGFERLRELMNGQG